MKLLTELDHSKQIRFYNDLTDRLPNNTHGANTKTAKSNYIDKYHAVHDYKFIRFNTKTAINILVFDIDNVIVDASYWYKRFYESTGIKPSYVSETTNGIQVGIFLTETAFIKDQDGNDTKNRIRLATLKKVIGSRLQFIFMGETATLTDIAGSNRLLGIWRNPILHNTVISSNTYTMSTLMQHFKVTEPHQPARKHLKRAVTACKMTLSETSPLNTALTDGFHQGNRNNYMFAYGYKTLFEDRSTLASIENIMQIENASYGNSMTVNEITAIANNIASMSDTMYAPVTKDKPVAKHREEMWTKSIHGTYNRQSFGAFKTASTKRSKTASTILNQLTALFELGKTAPTNADVVEGLEIKVRQYQNIKHNFDLGTVFLEWCFGMLNTANPIGIKANCMGIVEEMFKGVNKRVEKVFCEDGSIYFSMRDRDNWREEIKTSYPPLQATA